MTCNEALAALRAGATPKDLTNLQRFGIAATQPLGVSMVHIRKVAKAAGCDHALAAALWATNVYEARLLAAFVEEPDRVTPAQMDRWARGFDNWAVCDTHCFALFDRTPHAWAAIDRWAYDKREFVRRAAFALMASLAVHDKAADDSLFAERLPLIEAAASDSRDLVRKGVSWALRTTGRRNVALHRAALAVARTLAESDDRGARWVGKDAARELSGPIVARALKRVAAKKR